MLAFMESLEKKQTIIIIHGFGGNSKQDYIIDMQNALTKYALKTVVIDWYKYSEYPNYLKAVENIEIIAREIKEIININKYSNIHCIGYSMGAQICGKLGKLTLLNRITGLDPASPGFQYLSEKERLVRTDALFVDIIHTNAILGMYPPIGHADFYPNGGYFQNDCFNEIQMEIPSLEIFFSYIGSLLECSHRKAIDYFIESIDAKCKYKAYESINYHEFLNGKKSDQFVCMGFHVDTNSRGIYFIK